MSESVSARCAFLSVIDEKKDFLDGVADSLWETPELAFAEHRSAATLIAALKQEGFRVEENLAGIPTAFSGTFGSGSPVIGILGEFDALSGLGQESGALCQKPDGFTGRVPDILTEHLSVRPQAACEHIPALKRHLIGGHEHVRIRKVDPAAA